MSASGSQRDQNLVSGVGGWAEVETVLARERRRGASAARYAERRKAVRSSGLTDTASIAAISKDVVRNIAHNLWTKAISKGGSKCIDVAATRRCGAVYVCQGRLPSPHSIIRVSC
jgi:hypothetical protein